MSSKFLFLSGQIRAMEEKLLTSSQIDRLISATDSQSAFRILTELQYSEYLDEEIKPKDFLRIIYRGLRETKALIVRGTNDHQAFEFLWKEIDLNNLKRALKLKLVEGQSKIIKFREKYGFSELGRFTKEDIEKCVFENEKLDIVPDEYFLAILEAQAQYPESPDFQRIEYILDKAHFSYLDRLSKTLDEDFLKKILIYRADKNNVLAVARSVLLTESVVSPQAILPFGKVTLQTVQNIKNFDELNVFLQRLPHPSFSFALDSEISHIDNLLMLEKKLDLAMMKLLLESELGEIDSIKIPYVYFAKRLKNASILKFIMFAKLYGLSSDIIYKTIKHF